MKADTTGPGASSVCAFAIVQVHGIHISERIIRIIDDLPVDQISGFHNRHTRTHVHRGAAHVIGLAHPYHRGVRHIRKNDRVLRFCRQPAE